MLQLRSAIPEALREHKVIQESRMLSYGQLIVALRAENLQSEIRAKEPYILSLLHLKRKDKFWKFWKLKRRRSLTAYHLLRRGASDAGILDAPHCM